MTKAELILKQIEEIEAERNALIEKLVLRWAPFPDRHKKEKISLASFDVTTNQIVLHSIDSRYLNKYPSLLSCIRDFIDDMNSEVIGE